MPLRGSPQFWPTFALVAVFAVAFAPQSFLYGATDWEKVYVPAAVRFERGEDLFRDGFVYPPFAALLAVPSAHLGDLGVRANVWLMNTAGAALLVVGAWRLTGGRLGFRQLPREWLIVALGLPCFLGFLFEVMVNRQTDLLVGGLAVVGCGLVLRGRDWSGGALVGLAAAAKCTPLLFVLYFAWVGRWRAAAAVLLVAVLANLLPDLLVRPAGGPRLVEWAERVVLPMRNTDYQPGQWHAAEWSNHSIAGIIRRLSSFRLVADGSFEPRANPPTAGQLKWAVYGTGLALLLAAAVVLRRGGGRADPLGVGMTFGLMLLLSPMSSKPHFCVLAVSAWAAARGAVEGRRWAVLAAVVLAGACELTAAKDLVGGRVNAAAMWYGAIPLGVLLLVAACGWVRASGRGQPTFATTSVMSSSGVAPPR